MLVPRKGRIRLRGEAHLSKFLSTAALYVLGTLRSHGVTGRPLHDPAKATAIIVQIMYASIAWGAFKHEPHRPTRQIHWGKAAKRLPHKRLPMNSRLKSYDSAIKHQ